MGSSFVYRILFDINIVGMTILSFLNKKLIIKFSLNSLLITSNMVYFVTAALLLGLTFLL